MLALLQRSSYVLAFYFAGHSTVSLTLAETSKKRNRPNSASLALCAEIPPAAAGFPAQRNSSEGNIHAMTLLWPSHPNVQRCKIKVVLRCWSTLQSVIFMIDARQHRSSWSMANLRYILGDSRACRLPITPLYHIHTVACSFIICVMCVTVVLHWSNNPRTPCFYAAVLT